MRFYHMQYQRTTMQYLSDKKVASRYDSSRSTVWRWVKEGKLPQPIRLNGTSTRWKLSDLEQWESQQEQAGV